MVSGARGGCGGGGYDVFVEAGREGDAFLGCTDGRDVLLKVLSCRTWGG